ncbi:hypothetical protein QQ045_028953 [Rhodiola kirilowii]
MHYRDLHVSAIVHFTFKQANGWFIKRRDALLDHSNHHVLKIESIINENLEKSGRNKVQMYDRAKGITSKMATVSLSLLSCHALAVCQQEGISIFSCVTYEYTTQAYIDTWAPTFNLVLDMRHWKKYVGPKHIPSEHYQRVKKGRHPTKRRRNEMDQRHDPRSEDVPSTSSQPPTKSKRVFKCSICGTQRNLTNFMVEMTSRFIGIHFFVEDMPRRSSSEAMYDVPSPSAPSSTSLLVVRHRGHWVTDECILAYVVRAGFSLWYYIQNYEVDWSFMTALVEGWHSEMHILHLRHGEMTITLEDVGVLMELSEHLIISRPRKLVIPAPPSGSDVDLMRLPALGYKWNVPKPWMKTSHHVLMLYRDLLDRQEANDTMLLVRTCKVSSGVFLKTTDMDLKRALHDMFYATRADLVRIGEGLALDVDPKQISLHDDSDEGVDLHEDNYEVGGPSQVTQAES